MSSQADKRRFEATQNGDRPRSHRGDAEGAILDAAEQLLETLGLHELSVARIISAAGISRATFYFYFSSKFAVLTALVARAVDEILEVSEPFVRPAREVSPEEAIEQRIRSAAAVWRSHRPVLRATVENWHAFPELRTLWLEVIHRLSTGIASEIERECGRAEGSGRPDAKRLAGTLAWAIERTFYVAGLGVHDYLADEDEAVGAVTSLWRGALVAAPAPTVLLTHQ